MKQTFLNKAFVKACRSIYNERSLEIDYVFYFAVVARDYLRQKYPSITIDDVCPRWKEIAPLLKPMRIDMNVLDEFLDEFINNIYY